MSSDSLLRIIAELLSSITDNDFNLLNESERVTLDPEGREDVQRERYERIQIWVKEHR